MLGPDLVRARRRGDELSLSALKKNDREEALVLGTELIETASGLVGSTQEEVKEALGCIGRPAKLEKVFAGLLKLVLDDLSFTPPGELDAVALRREVFETACQARIELSQSSGFDREGLLARAAEARGTSPSEVEEALFSDLKGAQKLLRGPRLDAEELIERYELAQIQGVLLRAVRLTIVLGEESPEVYREIFSKLKFRQLLHRIEKSANGYRIEIDGPFSLFESVTKYGLQLALMVPAFLRCRRVELTAEVNWGKERRPLTFRAELQGKANEEALGIARMRSDVEALYFALRKKKSPFSVSVCSEILEVPGAGLCVPDLVFHSEGRLPVYLEVMGFWSRDAVWKRVEWVQAGSQSRVLFAVSSKLRVSSEVLSETDAGALYVYKGVMNAGTVLAHVEKLAVPESA